MEEPLIAKLYEGPEIIDRVNEALLLNVNSSVGVNEMLTSNFYPFFTEPNSLLKIRNAPQEFFLMAKSKLKSPLFSIVSTLVFFSFTNIDP